MLHRTVNSPSASPELHIVTPTWMAIVWYTFTCWCTACNCAWWLEWSHSWWHTLSFGRHIHWRAGPNCWWWWSGKLLNIEVMFTLH